MEFNTRSLEGQARGKPLAEGPGFTLKIWVSGFRISPTFVIHAGSEVRPCITEWNKRDGTNGMEQEPPNPVSFVSSCAGWDSAGKDYLAVLAILSPEW